MPLSKCEVFRKFSCGQHVIDIMKKHKLKLRLIYKQHHSFYGGQVCENEKGIVVVLTDQKFRLGKSE